MLHFFPKDPDDQLELAVSEGITISSNTHQVDMPEILLNDASNIDSDFMPVACSSTVILRAILGQY